MMGPLHGVIFAQQLPWPCAVRHLSIAKGLSFHKLCVMLNVISRIAISLCAVVFDGQQQPLLLDSLEVAAWKCQSTTMCNLEYRSPHSITFCIRYTSDVSVRIPEACSEAQVDEKAELRHMDEARLRSLADREAQVAAQKPLAQWPDADLLARFADSRVLPLVRCARSAFPLTNLDFRS